MSGSIARMACGCTYTAIEPRPVSGHPEEDEQGRPPEWIENEIAEPCVMHEDYAARLASPALDRETLREGHYPRCNDLCTPDTGMHVLLHSFPGEGEQLTENQEG